MRITRRRFVGTTFGAVGAVLLSRAPGAAAADGGLALPLDDAIAIAGSSEFIAVLYGGESPRVTVNNHLGADLGSVGLPADFVPRCVAVMNGKVLIGGAIHYVARIREFEVGDYRALQPPDMKDEPGVELWQAGGMVTETLGGFRPAILDVGAGLLEIQGSFSVGYEGGASVAQILVDTLGMLVFVERFADPTLPDGFVLEMVRADQSVQLDVGSRVPVPRHTVQAHETAAAVGYESSFNSTVVLHSTGLTRLARYQDGELLSVVDGPRIDDEDSPLGLSYSKGVEQLLVASASLKVAAWTLSGGATWTSEEITSAEFAVAPDVNVAVSFGA